MTPILVLLFGVNPGTAVSSDLLTSLVMKPVGAAVHFRRGTVNWRLARWLAVGAVPAAFAGVFVLNELGHGEDVARRIKTLLGWALIVAAISMVALALIGVGGFFVTLALFLGAYSATGDSWTTTVWRIAQLIAAVLVLIFVF